MRFKLSAGLLSLAAIGCLVAAPFAGGASPRAARQEQQQQQDEQDITESFVTSRGAGFGDRTKKPAPAPASSGKPSGTSSSTPPRKKVGEVSGKSTRPAIKGGGKTNAAPQSMTDTQPNQVNTAAKTAPENGGPKVTGPPAKSNPGNPAVEPVAAGAVGLGYTLLLVGDDNSNTVVDPTRAFTAGEKIRVALEANADGFLYIFNAENDRPDPVMLYPHAAIEGGVNQLAAHAREFFPTDLRYSFVFDETAATEHVYVIFSRRPLAEVPTGEALLEYCSGQSRDQCFWQPSPEQWARIKTAAAQGRVVESKNRDLAAAKTQLPPASLSRGIKIQKNEPAPTVVRMNASATADVLLSKIQLIHK